MNRITLALVALTVALAVPAFAKKTPDPVLPAYVTLPSNIRMATEGGAHVRFEDFGEAEFPVAAGHDATFVKQGKRWTAPLGLNDPPKDIAEKDIWALIKPSLVAGGWTVVYEADNNPFSSELHYQKGGKDTWALLEIFGPGDMALEMIETGTSPMTLALPAPAAAPEKIDPKHDFPWLLPLPGSGPVHSGSGGVMQVRLPGSDEDQLVGTDSITKTYARNAGLSPLQFETVYHDALVKAGWEIIDQTEGISHTDAAITAHYAKNGRNIWAYLHLGSEDYTLQVADSGAVSDIARTMAKDCHVALTGVLFDFNKATLKPESDAVLQAVLAFLQKDPTLALEVQGHTDNVGGDDYNQKLSEARAQSVLTWLTQHSIAAARLSFKGYGKTHPVATNDTDEGRARNRRVEIAKPGCTK